MSDSKDPHSSQKDHSAHTKKIIPFPPTDLKEDPPNRHSHHYAPKPPILFTAPLPVVPKDGLQKKSTEKPPNQEEYPEDIVFTTADLPPALPFMNTLLGLKLPLDEEGNVIQLPKEDGKFTAILKDLGEKADHYADHMFQESDPALDQEIKRLERLIPGTDKEEGKRVIPKEKKRKQPPPPDISFRKLIVVHQKQLTSISPRRNMMILLVILSTVLTLGNSKLDTLLPWITVPVNRVLALGGLLLLGLFLCWDVVIQGVVRGFHLKFGMDSLLVTSALVCLMDCLMQYTNGNNRGELPYVALILLTFTLTLHGQWDKKQAHKLACQVATKAKRPYILTIEPNKWNGRSAYTKCSDEATGFTSQLQMDDGSEKLYALFSPLLFMGSFVVALNVSPSLPDFFWAFSALLTASVPFAAQLTYGRGAFKMIKRLSKMRITLAGWAGVEKSCKQCVISDTDLFPVGATRLCGTRIFDGFKEKKVIAYTTALIKEGELGITRIFTDLMAKYGYSIPTVQEASYHEGGGITGKIGQESVMVGCATFMELMDITVPEGLYLPHAVFCAINNKIAGIFALDYDMPISVPVSLEAMTAERIRPILCTRDFPLEPNMLRQKFQLKPNRMDFPSITRRRELSQDIRPEFGTLTAVICREGLESLSDTVIAAKRLRNSTFWASGVALFSAFLGFGLAGYLTSQLAYSALSPENLLIFMVLWLAPVWVITDLPQRF